jgi:flagellar basal body-associated protein FliL
MSLLLLLVLVLVLVLVIVVVLAVVLVVVVVVVVVVVGTGKEDGSRRGAEAQRMTENEIGTRVIEAAIAVHRELGSGLLETVYEVTLARELGDRGLPAELRRRRDDDRYDALCQRP